MSRPLSLAARRAAFAQETDSDFILLCTISHPDLEEPIRVANDIVPEDADRNRIITSRGGDFVCYPYEVDLPADDGESVSRVTIVIDNVDRDVVKSLRTIQGPCDVALEVVLSANPDLVEAGPFDMTLVSVDYDAVTVSGELAFEDILTTAFPGDAYTPDAYPGLH